MKNIKNKKGFTLVELMVAMAIFIGFIGILIASYTSIVRAQREANEYRIMYSEARRVFETIVTELRNGMVDYGYYSTNLTGSDGVVLISKDALKRTEIFYNDIDYAVGIKREKLTPDTRPCIAAVYDFGDPVFLNSSAVRVTGFRVYFSPVIDPYALDNFDKNGNQFHPMVTVYAEFTREYSGNKEPFVMDLQTTISSRIYNQVYSTDIDECNLYNT